MEPGVFRAEHVTPIDMTQVESLTEKEALAHEHCSNVQMGLNIARVIKTTGGPKKNNKCTWIKDKHPPPAEKEKERRDSQANTWSLDIWYLVF